MEKQIKFLYTCSECESELVSCKAWVDLNSDAIVDTAAFDLEDYWCEECQDHRVINSKEIKDS